MIEIAAIVTATWRIRLPCTQSIWKSSNLSL